MTTQHERYNLKKIGKFNDIDQKHTVSDDIKNLIIKQTKIEKPNICADEMKKKIDDKKLEKEEELTVCHSKRTNQPYKGIIKNFDYSKPINNKDDLVIHKVSEQDKKHFDAEKDKFDKKKKDQDNELNNIYSLDNENKHIENFAYQHQYKFQKKIAPEGEDELRTDRIEFYEKEQRELINSKEKISDILNDLICSGGLSDNLETINYDKINVDDLEKALIEKFGKEEYEKLMKELK